MFSSCSSESERQDFIPSILQRPKLANHLIHESFTVDTRDHEDHTFCGVMFDIGSVGFDTGRVPVEFLEVDSVSIRGDLGPITVWTTTNSYKGKEHNAEAWQLVYERTHEPSRREHQRLQLDKPIRIKLGETCGLYVHSKLSGDDAIVYDNQRSRVAYEDQIFRVLPGLAHLSNRPFGRHGMWGFPWRECREFVGRISYGVSYVLWNPETHGQFPSEFRDAACTMLLCARRMESPLYWLQDEVVFYILNMCRHDWFSKGAPALTAPASQAAIGSSGDPGSYLRGGHSGFSRFSLAERHPVALAAGRDVSGDDFDDDDDDDADDSSDGSQARFLGTHMED